MTKILETDYYKMRVWKEYYFRYTEDQNNSKGDANFQMDRKAALLSIKREKLFKLL